MGNYALDPSMITLDRFLELTSRKRMLPGRVMLHENMEERFGILQNSGITTLEELIRELGTRAKTEAFASQTGLDHHYLLLLRREAGSYLARPFPLSDFPGIPFEYVESLKSKGIRNTREFYELAESEQQRKELGRKTGIPEYRLKELYELCDLSRITGVGGTMARISYEAGIRSTREFVQSGALLLVQFSMEDIQYCMDYANVIVECENNS